MRLLRWVVLGGAMMCAGGVASSQGQGAAKLKREPKSLDETMVWLRQSVAATGGFALGTDRLRYEFSGQEMCQLSWRAAATGDEDLLSLYPGIEQVEELKGIVPESVRVLPVDVRGLLAGGTGAASGGEAGVYWKITASYVDGRKLPEEPFGFVFADRETAQRVAAVLADGVSQCRMPGAKTVERENDIGCDGSPGLKVSAPTPGAKNGDHLENQGNLFLPGGKMYYGPLVLKGEFVNRASGPVSCIFDAGYYQIGTPHEWVRQQYLRLDLPRGTSWGEIDFPEFLDALPRNPHYTCFAQGAVNAAQKACADLHHPIHLNLHNGPVKP